MTRPRRILKWVGILIAGAFLIYAAIFTTFLIGYFYTQPKFAAISTEDTRATVDARKGLLRARDVDASFLNGYQTVFQDLVDDPTHQIVAYTFLLAHFTVIYDNAGNVLAHIDNGLDG